MANRDTYHQQEYDLVDEQNYGEGRRYPAGAGGSKVGEESEEEDYGADKPERERRGVSGARMRKINKKKYEEVADYDDEESSGGEEEDGGRPLR